MPKNRSRSLDAKSNSAETPVEVTRRFFQYDPQQGVVEVTKRKLKLRPKWPLHSDAMGVNPEQVPEAMALAKSRGVHTEYDSDGCPVLTGPDHFRRHAQAFGFFDRNGVWSPKNR